VSEPRKVWLQHHRSVLPHFRVLGTLPRSFQLVSQPDDADILVAQLDALETLPTPLADGRELVATDIYSADPDGVEELRDRALLFRLGQPSVIAAASIAEELDLARPSEPTFVELLIQDVEAELPSTRVAEALGTLATLGVEPSLEWKLTATTSAIAIAADDRTLGIAATHRLVTVEPPSLEIARTSQSRRTKVVFPLDGTARPSEISREAGSDWSCGVPVFASPLREFWAHGGCPRADWLVAVLRTARQL
jgi:hypothetical protein